MSPLKLLFERDDLPRFSLSTPLSTGYDGDFGIDGSHTYANFVSSLDGVVALRQSGESGRIVSGDSAWTAARAVECAAPRLTPVSPLRGIGQLDSPGRQARLSLLVGSLSGREVAPAGFAGVSVRARVAQAVD